MELVVIFLSDSNFVFLGGDVWAIKEAEKEAERAKKVELLQKLVSEHEAMITIDDETLRQELDYDHLKDTSVEAVIMDGFQKMRVQGCPEVVRMEIAVDYDDNDAQVPKEHQLMAFSASHQQLVTGNFF